MSEKLSILAVDDEPFNLDLIEAAFLEYDDVIITFATSGEEALAHLNSSLHFNVVLLDIRMPGMNGLEVLQEMKENEDLKDIPVVMVTAEPRKAEEAFALGATDYIEKPFDLPTFLNRTRSYAKLNQTLQLAKQTEYEISVRLGRASEFRDLETGGHIKRMSHYSQLLASLHGLGKEESELVLYAAPLHDIGKVGIPDRILLKPGKFEGNEFTIMKQHAALGAKMLEGADKFPVLKAGHTIALQHHEKWDGSGYPNGLAGEDIHLYARIVAIADVFDALSSKRCYKEPMPLETVLMIMKKDAGTHFDPNLVELFLANLDKFLAIQEKYKDDENAKGIMDIINEIKS